MQAIKQTAIEIRNLNTFDKIGLIPGVNVITNVALLALKVLSQIKFTKCLTDKFTIQHTKSFKEIMLGALPIIGTFYSFSKLVQSSQAHQAAQARLQEEPLDPTPRNPDAALEELPPVVTAAAVNEEVQTQARERIERFTRKFIQDFQDRTQEQKQRDKCAFVACCTFAAFSFALFTANAINHYYFLNKTE